MSKELVRRLRGHTAFDKWDESKMLCNTAADRIEALESRLTRARELLTKFKLRAISAQTTIFEDDKVRELHLEALSDLDEPIDATSAFLSESGDAKEPTLICPRCNVDRYKTWCPNLFDCPLTGHAQIKEADKAATVSYHRRLAGSSDADG